MRRFTIAIIAVTFVGLGALLLNVVAPYKATAQNNNNVGQALEISPPLMNLVVDPGETVTANIMLRSIANGQLLVTSQINDFVAAGEDGTPKILLEDDPNAEPSPYSMKGWVDPLQQMLLEPREIQDLKVTIRVPKNASPGGYFGVVRFTAVPPELEGTGVSLSASLGTLMLVRVSGDAKESMEIEEFSINKDGKSGSLFESIPLQFVERLKNTGNIHLQPQGHISITDMFGNKVAGVNVNLPPGNVLPSSIRKFEQTLDESQLGDRKLFGRYTAELAVTYGDSEQTVTSKFVFWVIPWRLILAIVGVLIVGFFILRHMIRRYNRRIISKATGKAPPKKSKRKRK